MPANTPSSESARTAGPAYDNPPVVETALSIQFEDLSGFTATTFGLYYETVRDRYPVAEDQPRLSPISEPFPARPRVPKLEFRQPIGPQRVWFKDTEEGTRLIQLQSDRFGFNWRETDPGRPYPRYTANARECLSEFERFLAFCERQGLSEVKPTLCEVVYVNRISPIEGESPVELFGRVFTGLEWKHATSFLPTPETARFDRVYEIEEQRGRLYAEASIAVDQSKQEFVYLKMTGRVLYPRNRIVRPGALGDVESSMRLAHDWVVNGFECLTDEEMQRERWRKRHDGD